MSSAGKGEAFYAPFDFTWLRKIGQPTLYLSVAFLAVNGFVLANALLHDPHIGYDAGGHMFYMLELAGGRMPTPERSTEFFSPPLPYALPAITAGTGLLPWSYSFKLAQLLNWLASICLTLVLLKTADFIRPGRTRFKVAVLVILGTLPVYYKSFAFIRGEPWVALFAGLVVYESLALFGTIDEGGRVNRRAFRLGLWLGLAILSRQWAFSLIPPLVFFFLVASRRREDVVHKQTRSLGSDYDLGRTDRPGRSPLLRAGLIAGTVALLVGGWFYVYLYVTYGSAAAFNREPNPTLSLANHPDSFYLDLSPAALFSDPVRPAFPNQLWPKLYAETWGDFDAYFLIFGRDTRDGRLIWGPVLESVLRKYPILPDWLETNRAEMGAYLGRVNRIALGMTMLLLAGFVLGGRETWRWLLGGRWINRRKSALALLWLVIVASMTIYFGFLILYPNFGSGDTIKATYLLHIFPFLAILAAELMERVEKRSRPAYWLIWILIAVTIVFLLPTYVTRYAG